MQQTLRRLNKIYPDIRWGIAEPTDEILSNYGNGMILFGAKQGQIKEFFILEEDKDKLKWGIVIANYLNNTVKEDHEPTEV